MISKMQVSAVGLSSVTNQHFCELLVVDDSVLVLVNLCQEVLCLLVRQLVPDIGDEIFELFVSDVATAGFVQCPESHPDGLQVMDHQHPAAHHVAELVKLDGPVVV